MQRQGGGSADGKIAWRIRPALAFLLQPGVGKCHGMLRQGKQHVIGLICININLDVPVSQFLSSFIALQETEGSVNFASSVEDLVAQTIENTIEEVQNDRHVSNSNKNRQIVTALFEKGIFDIKDAINQVAERLDISRHTVYLYIRQLKQDGE